MSTKIRGVIRFVSEVLLIVGVTLFAVLPVSCKITETGIHVLNGDYVCPKMENFSVVDERRIKLDFSEPVKLKSFEVFTENEKSIKSGCEVGEAGKEIFIELDEQMEIGKRYELFGVVKDEYGNTLTFEVPFLGYNGRVPKLIMTEIQTVTVSSRTKVEVENDWYKNEFIEFLALTDGNLSGVEVISSYDGEDRGFLLPPVEVKQGEIFIVHLRNKGNGCVSETGENLNLATAPYSMDGVRDFWTADERTAIGNKTDIVIIKDSGTNEILDGLLFCESKYEQWPSKQSVYVKDLCEAGICNSEEIEIAFAGDVLGNTKTLQRMNAKSVLDEFKKNKECHYPLAFCKEDWSVDSHTAGSL